jgi:hypothetical protein
MYLFCSILVLFSFVNSGDDIVCMETRAEIAGRDEHWINPNTLQYPRTTA